MFETSDIEMYIQKEITEANTKNEIYQIWSIGACIH